MDYSFLSYPNLYNHYIYCDALRSELHIKNRDILLETLLISHDLYFNSFTDSVQKVPKPARRLIECTWGVISDLYIELMNEAMNLEDQGFVYLSMYRGCLELNCMEYSEKIRNGSVGLLALDMWEHAYYLDYNCDKERYVKRFCEHIDWEKMIYRVNMGRYRMAKI